MLSLHHVRYSIGNKEILRLKKWYVKEEQHCLILGPSGSGKTTLLYIIAGLLEPTEGRVMVAGESLYDLVPSSLDRFRGHYIGIVFQTLHLVKSLTVGENLRLAQYVAGLPQDDVRVRGVLYSLGLEKYYDAPVRVLSHGQAQRVAVGRAIINAPKLILADEPTSSLDDYHCEQVLDLLESQAEECGATLIIATHDMRVKQRFAKTLELEHGA